MSSINEACAVVFSSDGTHIVCATPDDMVDAINAIVASGCVPNPFTRKIARPQVTNQVNGNVHGSITMAHTIHGGVRA